MKEIPTWEPMLEMESNKKPEGFPSYNDMQYALRAPRLRPWMKTVLQYIIGFAIGFISMTIILYFLQ